MARTLVTGATGFIGSHLTRLLVEQRSPVRVLARPNSCLNALTGLPIEIVYGDLRDPGTLVGAVQGVRRIFHVAADYRLWSREPQTIYESNVAGTHNLLQACRGLDLERFVYTSSIATVGARGAVEPVSEASVTSIADMIGEYKRSKFLAEREVLAAASTGVPVVVVNPTTPVGPGDWKPTPTGAIIVNFLRGRMPCHVDTGLNLVSVEDVARGHILAAERGRVGERYLIGGQNVTLQQILAMLADISGRRVRSVRIPHLAATGVAYASELLARLRNTEPMVPLDGVRMARHRMFADCSKAKCELGFEAGCVRAALERAVFWYHDHGYVNRSKAVHPAVASSGKQFR